MIGHDEGLDIAEKLTGKRWIPYPNNLFYEALEKATDKEKLELILERRKHYFPEFLAGEPQYDSLMRIINNASH